MANPRKFSEKIALLNQKQAEETARFEQIMKEVSDVTSRAASASSSVAASPMSGGKPSEILSGGAGSKTSSSGAATPGGPPAPRPLSVKSAGASPPQSSDNHLHISLGNQYRAGGSLPNVNAGGQGQPAGPQEIATSAAIHSIDLKTALNTLEEMQQQNQMAYRQGPGSSPGPPERGRNHDRVGGPMRSRPMEKRHDTSPYSGQPYLSPPNIETWRRTNSDSALHQSANEACQGGNTGHRRDQQRHSTPGTDPSQHYTGQFIERPRSSCEIPRVPGINIFPSSQPPGPQIPICKNTGSLPDLSNVHFSSPMPTPLDQEDHSSGSQYSNSPQPSSPTTLSPTSLAQAVGLSLTQDHSPPSAQNRLSVPVNHRFLPSCKQGLTADNNTSSSQQDVRITYPQQTSPVQQHHPGLPHSQPQNIPGSASPGGFQQPGHSPGHYVHYQPHSPSNPISPNSQVQMHQQNTQGQFNSLSYRTSQMVNRPSPQSSPSLTFQGSPLSYSNNPSAPSSPTSHIGPPNLSLDPSNDNVYINQVHAEFESFTMDWVQMMQQLEDTGYSLSTPLDEMDSPSTNMTHYMNSPSHNTGQCNQSDILNVGEMPSGDGGYYSTSPLGQLSYQARSTNTTQQMTPQTPNTPTIVLTDCSLVPDDLVGTDFGKDFSAAIAPFGQDVFPLDDPLVPDLNALHQEDINALRNDLDPVDLEDLQRLSNADMVLSDPVTEDNFRLEQH